MWSVLLCDASVHESLALALALALSLEKYILFSYLVQVTPTCWTLIHERLLRHTRANLHTLTTALCFYILCSSCWMKTTSWSDASPNTCRRDERWNAFSRFFFGKGGVKPGLSDVVGAAAQILTVYCLLTLLVRYQQILHRNIVYLGTIADASPDAPSPPSDVRIKTWPTMACLLMLMLMPLLFTVFTQWTHAGGEWTRTDGVAVATQRTGIYLLLLFFLNCIFLVIVE